MSRTTNDTWSIGPRPREPSTSVVAGTPSGVMRRTLTGTGGGRLTSRVDGEHGGTMDRLMLISCDCHAGLLPQEYAQYLEHRYHDDLAAYLRAATPRIIDDQRVSRREGPTSGKGQAMNV